MRGKVIIASTISATLMFSNVVGAYSSDNFLLVSDNTASSSTDYEAKWDYKKDFSKTDLGSLNKVKGNGEFSIASNTLDISSKINDETIIIDRNSPNVYNGEAEFVFDPKNDNEGSMYGIIFRYAEDGSWTFIGQDGHSAKDPYLTSWVMHTSDGKKQLLQTDGQRIYARRKKPYTLKVRFIDNSLILYLDNAMIFSGEVDGMTQKNGKIGLLYSNGSGANVQYIAASKVDYLTPETSQTGTRQISSNDMNVKMDSDFPRVVEYQLKSNNAKVYGQEIPYYVVEINNISYKPTVSTTSSENQIIYHLTIDGLGVSFDVIYTVEDNVLKMQISNIDDKNYTIKTINFPNQSMVSMRNNAPNGELRVNNYRKEQIYSLDELKEQTTYYTTSIATLSCDDIAVTINNGNINNRQEIAYQTVKKDDYLITGLWTNEFQYKGLDNEPITDLWACVAITGDRNNDGIIDYQDAAIARRDDIGTQRLGTEEYQNSMSMIAMNVGSVAQYPFLRILDNIKKFNLGTDGFEQMILIKGYQSEGHDASHPDYANISQKAGGIEDFQTFLNEAGKYGAKIGLHINHTEAYPEAKQYSEDLIADTPGWSWYDDSYHIIRENDILDKANGLEKRLDDLAQIANGKLSMIYVDTYQDSRWQADKIAEKIKDLGWSLGTEYSEELIKLSTWSHTINSKNIDYNTQGNLVRFVDNQNKDIFGNSPLFRGLDNRNRNAGFDGWQRNFSYDTTMESFYTKVLPQRYLAHFPVNQWESNDKIYLGYDNQVVTELVDGVNRIYKDGNLIAEGNKIFIPWNPQDESKIYHWNSDGGTSTWTLPVSWSNEMEVKLFTLTDEGRIDETLLPITDNAITLDAQPKTAYVIYKGTTDISETDITSYDWSAGSPVKDMGFDSHTFGYAWDKSSLSGNTDHIQFVNNYLEGTDTKDIADNSNGNTHIHVQGKQDAVLTQVMDNLKPNQSYSASVFVEGSEGRKLSITVTTPDGKSVSNYADDFTIDYGNTHNDRYGSYYQRVKLNFTQPEGFTTAKIQLKAETVDDDSSWANFDNVRVTPVNLSDNRGHYYFEDFENIDQEFGPFVTPVQTDSSHLSEANGEWTKDVIEGRYSLKIRGVGDSEENINYFRTAAHRLRLLPNTTYAVSFDYMITDTAANESILEKGDTAFVLGVKSDKAKAANDLENAVIVQKPYTSEDSSVKSTGKVTFTTGDYDDYYIDILDDTYSHEIIVDNFALDK